MPSQEFEFSLQEPQLTGFEPLSIGASGAPQERTSAPKSEFLAKLEARWSRGNFVSIGLDTDAGQIPQRFRRTPSDLAGTMFDFNREIIDATADLAVAFKPNSAFYEGHGRLGLEALARTIGYINSYYPDIPVILDAKRGDIGSTNAGYVTQIFDNLGADATTVSPYLGREAMQPFLDRKDKGVFVLARTSNPGAGEFQDLPFYMGEDRPDKFLFEIVAEHVANEWNGNGNVGLVAGATYPEELMRIREIAPDLPILIPGIGAQGGDLEQTVKAGKDAKNQGMVINSSRGIIYAFKGPEHTGKTVGEAARYEAQALTDHIRETLAS